MKITHSNISFSNQHTNIERHDVRENLRVWTGNSRPDFEDQSRANNGIQPAVIVSISAAARVAQNSEAEEIKNTAEDIENEPKIQLIRHMVEAMTGKKIDVLQMKDFALNPEAQQYGEDVAQATEARSQQRVGWGVEYDYQESHYEAEQTTFSAQGSIRTADGHDIQFQLKLQMQREFMQESNISIRAGDAQRKDPLVINFNGASAQLTDTKFAFDIDSDGNQWIDENDAIYADLRVWSKDANGQDELTTLAQRNVGALYLGNTTTPFAINNTNNTSLGMVRSSGVYLTEEGGVGTLQQ